MENRIFQYLTKRYKRSMHPYYEKENIPNSSL